jgi:hypothetical protein
MSAAIKERYHAVVLELLQDDPERLQQFEQLWSAGKLREAYLLVDTHIRQRGIATTEQFG